MTDREKAMVMLETIEKRAPTNINWNMQQQWLDAIIEGFREIENSGGNYGKR